MTRGLCITFEKKEETKDSTQLFTLREPSPLLVLGLETLYLGIETLQLEINALELRVHALELGFELASPAVQVKGTGNYRTATESHR